MILSRKVPSQADLKHLGSFDLAFMSLTGHVEWMDPFDSLFFAQKAVWGHGSKEYLWGPEADLLSKTLAAAWKKVGAEHVKRIQAAFDLSGDVSVSDAKLKKALAGSKKLGKQMWLACGKKVRAIVETTVGRAQVHFDRQRSMAIKAVTAAGWEGALAAASTDHVQAYMTQYPDRILHPEVQRLAELTRVKPAARTIDRIQLRDRIGSIHGKGEQYFANMSDVQVGRTWTNTGIQMAHEQKVTEYMVVSEGDAQVCPACKRLHGKHFPVGPAYDKMQQGMQTTNPDKLNKLFPFPRVKQLDNKSTKQIRAMNLQPPFHGKCRCDVQFLWRQVAVDKKTFVPDLSIAERKKLRALAEKSGNTAVRLLMDPKYEGRIGLLGDAEGNTLSYVKYRVDDYKVAIDDALGFGKNTWRTNRVDAWKAAFRAGARQEQNLWLEEGAFSGMSAEELTALGFRKVKHATIQRWYMEGADAVKWVGKPTKVPKLGIPLKPTLAVVPKPKVVREVKELVDSPKERKRICKEIADRGGTKYSAANLRNFEEGTEHIPIEVLEELNKRGLRAKWVSTSETPGASHTGQLREVAFGGKRDFATVAHEVGHAIDTMATGRWGEYAHLQWKKGVSPVNLDEADAKRLHEALMKWTKGRSVKSKAKWDNWYFFEDNGVDAYDFRSYSGEVGVEWWSMNTERYVKYRRRLVECDKKWMAMKKKYPKGIPEDVLAKASTATNIERQWIEGKLTYQEMREKFAAEGSKWARARRCYGDTLEIIEKAYLKPRTLVDDIDWIPIAKPKIAIPTKADVLGWEKGSDAFEAFLTAGEKKLPSDLKKQAAARLKARLATSADKSDYDYFCGHGWHAPPDFDYEADLIRNWACTSADKDGLAILLQKAAKEEFGLSKAATKHFSLEGEEALAKLLKGKDANRVMRGARVFVREMRNETQAVFKAAGIKELTLFRGATLKDVGFDVKKVLAAKKRELDAALLKAKAKVANLKKLPKVPKDEYEAAVDALYALKGELRSLEKGRVVVAGLIEAGMQPMSSFSTNLRVAYSFMSSSTQNFQSMTALKVPIDRIISCPLTGFGCLGEAEVVVLGGLDDLAMAAVKANTKGALAEWLKALMEVLK